MSIFSIAAEDAFNTCCMFVTKLIMVNYGKSHSKTLMASPCLSWTELWLEEAVQWQVIHLHVIIFWHGIFQVHSIQYKPVVSEPRENHTWWSDDETGDDF